MVQQNIDQVVHRLPEATQA
jgi:hypothetical protein